MPEKNYDRRPRTHTTVKLKSRFEGDEYPNGRVYVPTFSTVFRDDHLPYGKCYDVFKSDYLEPERYDEKEEKWVGEPLIMYAHLGLWDDLYYAAERGERFNHDDLAARRWLNPRTLREMLDRLEDARLIISVKDLKAKGHPTHIIVCTPYSPEELREGGMRAKLAARIAGKETAKAREEGKALDKAGGRRGRTKWPHVRWDVAIIRKAIMVPNLARDLHAITERIVLLKEKLKGEKWEETTFYAEVKRLCRLAGLPFNRELYCTALTFQVAGLSVPSPPEAFREPRAPRKKNPERPAREVCTLCDDRGMRRIITNEYPTGVMKRCTHDQETEAQFPSAN